MKEFLYEIATFLLAAVQAFWLVWVTGVFVRGSRRISSSKAPKNGTSQIYGCKYPVNDV